MSKHYVRLYRLGAYCYVLGFLGVFWMLAFGLYLYFPR